jgi:hypothetical protein
MMVKDLVDKFGLAVTAGERGLDRKVTEGYCGDLLSEIMGNAPAGCAWMTVQGHQNGGQTPDDETIKKADQEGIPILLWPNSSFSLAGRLFSVGVGNPATQ